MVRGNLREQFVYPHNEEGAHDELIKEALKKVNFTEVLEGVDGDFSTQHPCIIVGCRAKNFLKSLFRPPIREDGSGESTHFALRQSLSRCRRRRAGCPRCPKKLRDREFEALLAGVNREENGHVAAFLQDFFVGLRGGVALFREGVEHEAGAGQTAGADALHREQRMV